MIRKRALTAGAGRVLDPDGMRGIVCRRAEKTGNTENTEETKP